MQNIHKKVAFATKWSIITEIIVKLISPLTNMILARLLTPEIFGVVASVTLVASFADIFTDAGFQKYIIQHEFKNKDDYNYDVSVAFWTNLACSALIWASIIAFNGKIAIFVGCEGYGNVISVTGCVLILTSFSSIQMAVYKKSFKFKSLAFIRIIGKCIPLFVTIPLAWFGYGYWSLIIGNIVGELVNAFALTMNSEWKPLFKYSFLRLKKMFSFCGWTLCESVTAWLVANAGVFMMLRIFDSYYSGLYKASITTVSQILSVITAVMGSIILTTLSSLQNDEANYKTMIFNFQKSFGMFVLPLGVGMFVFRNTVTYILLGSQWMNSSLLIGCWGFASSINIVFGNIGGFILLSKGKPKYIFYSNLIQFGLLIPAFLLGSRFGFNMLVIVISLISLQISLSQVVFSHKLLKFKSLEMINGVKNYIIASIIMGLLGSALQKIYSSLLVSLVYIFICFCSYFLVLILWKDERKQLKSKPVCCAPPNGDSPQKNKC